MPDSIKCQFCGLVNFQTDFICKRCKAQLNSKTVAENKGSYDGKKFVQKWGLQEFEVPEGETIPLSKLPTYLGITGCIKLIVMIATIILLAIYGGKFILYILPEWFSTRLKYAIGLIILFVPIIFSPFLAVRITDRLFKLLGLLK